MLVKKALTKDVHYVDPDTSIKDVAKLMEENDCGSILVGKDDKLVGIITDRDIVLRCVTRDFDPVIMTAKTCMSPGVLYCYENEEVEDVLRNMGEQAIRRLPVLNEDKKLVGIVSFGDLSAACEDKTVCGEAMEQIRKAS